MLSFDSCELIGGDLLIEITFTTILDRLVCCFEDYDTRLKMPGICICENWFCISCYGSWYNGIISTCLLNGGCTLFAYCWIVLPCEKSCSNKLKVVHIVVVSVYRRFFIVGTR